MAELHLPTDYEDLLREFSECGVEFLLVGGWAVAVHGHGRATDDIDLFVRADPANARRIIEALHRFGAPLSDHEVDEGLFSHERYGYRMGRKPQVIEILTRIDGVTFDEAAEDAVVVSVADFQIPVIGRRALLVNKRTARRPKDLADVAALENDE
ncbi:MAG: nucleotidyl transferase AbiEii/AbiGii toxin family protein [Nannocystaceae bacterium]|nr:nucleotidyltransferase [bacterium]